MEYVDGDLIRLAIRGDFDVITHGCNCWCAMNSGIAVPMKEKFKCDTFEMETQRYRGDYNKMGTIDYEVFRVKNGFAGRVNEIADDYDLAVVNSYTQFAPGQATHPYDIPLDYDALRMCFRKINKKFKGKHLGIPKIGCGLAGGKWEWVSSIIDDEACDMKVTCVIFDN